MYRLRSFLTIHLLLLAVVTAAQPSADRDSVPPAGLFSEPPIGPLRFAGQFASTASELGKAGDLVFLYETQSVKWQRWSSYRARKIKTITHAIVLDSLTKSAWHQTFTNDRRLSRKRNDPSKKVITINEYSRRTPLAYHTTLNAFRKLDSLGFHRLDPEQLTSTEGPPNPDGSVPMLTFTHTSSTWTYLKANGLWYGIVTYAAAILYAEYPEMFPDRGKWVEGYDTMRALTR